MRECNIHSIPWESVKTACQRVAQGATKNYWVVKSNWWCIVKIIYLWQVCSHTIYACEIEQWKKIDSQEALVYLIWLINQEGAKVHLILLIHQKGALDMANTPIPCYQNGWWAHRCQDALDMACAPPGYQGAFDTADIPKGCNGNIHY